MDPMQYLQSLGDFWGKSGQTLVASQQNLFREMTTWMEKAAKGEIPMGGLVPAPTSDAAGFAQAAQHYGQLWSSALELSGTVTRNLQAGGPKNAVVTETLGRIFDPRTWLSSTDDMDEALQRMAEGPRLADLWDVERKVLAVVNAWMALRRRNVEHNTLMLETWLQAAGDFARSMNEKVEKGETLDSWRDVMSQWVETANIKLLETQRSEAFLASQREVLKASTDLRLAQTEIASFYSEMFGYPTRAEFDDVNKRLTELRREMRAMRREARRRPPALTASATSHAVPPQAAQPRSDQTNAGELAVQKPDSTPVEGKRTSAGASKSTTGRVVSAKPGAPTRDDGPNPDQADAGATS